MTDFFRLIFDPYSRQARLYPALLTLLPPISIILAFWPNLLAPTSVKVVVGFATAFGLLYLLASFARSRGKRVEKRLLAAWEAWPTTIWLRHRGGFLKEPTLARYHEYLTKNVPGLKMPTQADELADAAKADIQYASAVEWLKEQCRGKAHALVEKENTEYGFRRNLRGMRPTGVCLCVVGTFAATLAMLAQADSGMLTQPAHLWFMNAKSPISAAIILNIVVTGAWLVFVNDSWVREGADQYARALLANCESVGGTKPTRRARKPAVPTGTP